ncbi:MAG TPA: hypothetical protein VD837_07120 [Terriglobales bacterium]|nr:hypothetical protein [Terriglobales bacterium]
MTKKNILLILAVVLLAGLSLYLNRDRFRSESIQIGERWVEPRGSAARRGQHPSGRMLVFLLDAKLELTSVKVVPLEDVKTNRFPHPIWELTTESNSVPVKDIVYGMPIRGMRPKVKGAIAGPLQPKTEYRLFVEAGSLKTTHDFVGSPPSP